MRVEGKTLMDNGGVVLVHETQKVELCGFIALKRAEMVEMLFKDVQQNAHARAVVHVFQLMCRKLVDHDGIRFYLFHHVETRDANISGENRVTT